MIACLERWTWSYLQMAGKWKNPFCTRTSRLMVVLQSRLRYYTHIWSMDLVYSVPFVTGIQTVNRVRFWDWCNKSQAIIVSRKPIHNSSFSWPTSHLPLFIDRAICKLHADNGQRHPPEARTWVMTGGEVNRKDINYRIEERYWHKKMGIQRKIQENVRKYDNKKDQISL